MSEKKELAVLAQTQGQLATINEFFGNVDFQKLNDTIVKLSSHENLSKIEKKSAMEVIDSWNANIIDKLRLEKDKIDMFVSSLYGAGGNGVSNLINSQEYIDELEMVIDYVGAQEQYDELVDTMDAYAVANGMTKNVQHVVIDLETTKAEEIIMEKDCVLERIKVNAELTRIGNRIAKLNSEIIKLISGSKDMVVLIRGLKKKAKAMDKMRVDCTDKAQMAKINVTIDDADVRATLKELIEFSF